MNCLLLVLIINLNYLLAFPAFNLQTGFMREYCSLDNQMMGYAGVGVAYNGLTS